MTDTFPTPTRIRFPAGRVHDKITRLIREKNREAKMEEQTELVDRTPEEWLEGDWQTRDGREVVIRHVETEVETMYPVVGFVGNSLKNWQTNGKFARDQNQCDLVPAPKKHTRFLNVYASNIGHPSKALADACAGARIACVEVTFTEGEGLE